MIAGIKPRENVILILPNGSIGGYMIEGTVGFFDYWNGKRVMGFYTNDPNALLFPQECSDDFVRLRPDRRNPSMEVYKLRIHLDAIGKIEII